MITQRKRPVYLDLLRIRLPTVGLMSIGHRISGVLMFFAIPVFLYLLELSVTSAAGYDRVAAIVGSVGFRLLVVVMVWSLVHHFCAGIRYLLLDVDVGVEKTTARQSARAVLVIGIVAAVITFVGVFV